MHSPMQSLGEIRMQPSTPISASGECGGSRSTLGPEPFVPRCERVYFKSGFSPFGSLIRVPIDMEGHLNLLWDTGATVSYWPLSRRYSEVVHLEITAAGS